VDVRGDKGFYDQYRPHRCPRRCRFVVTRRPLRKDPSAQLMLLTVKRYTCRRPWSASLADEQLLRPGGPSLPERQKQRRIGIGAGVGCQRVSALD
jgi:hypothetical protein